MSFPNCFEGAILWRHIHPSIYIHSKDVGDLVIINHIRFDKLKVGDIIVFKARIGNGQEGAIIHRIYLIRPIGNPVIVTAKGDANLVSIPGVDFPITNENYVGKVVYVISKAGVALRLISPPVNYIIFGIIIVVVVLKLRKRKKRELT
jgi:signal peptidase I